MKPDSSKRKDSNSCPAFLPAVEKAINGALGAVAVQKTDADLSVEGPPRQSLERLRDRIFGLNACADRPEQAVRELDAALRVHEEKIREYLQAVDGLRQKLAEWGGRAIG
jgi:hypothetical protein